MKRFDSYKFDVIFVAVALISFTAAFFLRGCSATLNVNSSTVETDSIGYSKHIGYK